MNVLDRALLVIVLAYAASGYWQGFISGAFATAGLLLKGLVGIWLAPQLLGDAESSLWVSSVRCSWCSCARRLGRRRCSTPAPDPRPDHLAAGPRARRRAAPP